MRRRDLNAFFGSTAVTRPLATRAQQAVRTSRVSTVILLLRSFCLESDPGDPIPQAIAAEKYCDNGLGALLRLSRNGFHDAHG
jgi:hypothetical protein